MGNSCKHCSCNENNKNTIEMNTENDQIKHDDLVLLSNRIISTDSAGKVNLTSDDKINEYKYLNDFEILEKNLNEFSARKINSAKKKERNKLTPDLLIKRKIIENKKTDINIVILGDSEVGKSSFAIQYVKNKFEQFHVITIGAEHLKTYNNCNDTRYTINFFITSGVYQYKTDYTNYFEIADFFLIFFDVSKFSSYENIPCIIKEIKNYIFKYRNDASNVIIVGNKCELKNREISKEEAEIFCAKNFLKYYEISVKSKINMHVLVEDILCTYHNF